MEPSADTEVASRSREQTSSWIPGLHSQLASSEYSSLV
jgi:hypothetical protein